MRPYLPSGRDTFAHERVSAPPPLVLSSSARKNAQITILQKKKAGAGDGATGYSKEAPGLGLSSAPKKTLAPWAKKEVLGKDIAKEKDIEKGAGGSWRGNGGGVVEKSGEGGKEIKRSADWTARAIDYLHNVDNKSVLVLNEKSEHPSSWQDYKNSISKVDEVFPSLNGKSAENIRKGSQASPLKGERHGEKEEAEGLQNGSNAKQDAEVQAQVACTQCAKLEKRMNSMTDRLFEYKTSLLTLQRQVEKLEAENAELRSAEKRLLARIEGQGSASVSSYSKFATRAVHSFSPLTFIGEIVDELVGLSLLMVSGRPDVSRHAAPPRKDRRVEGRTLSSAEIKAIDYVDTMPRRPQLDFLTPVDNTDKPFEHRVARKPFARVRLDPDETSVHPFRTEIKKLMYSKGKLR